MSLSHFLELLLYFFGHLTYNMVIYLVNLPVVCHDTVYFFLYIGQLSIDITRKAVSDIFYHFIFNQISVRLCKTRPVMKCAVTI